MPPRSKKDSDECSANFISKKILTHLEDWMMTDIRTIKVSQKGQISIPTDIRKKMKIKHGDDLVMIIKDSKIVLEKSEDVGLILDGEFKDVKAITEEGLKKLWINEHDDAWNRYGRKSK
jgi:AbrB family looped-hinge helix DNA binding protein